MLEKLKLPKLRSDESFIIETNLTRQQAIDKLQNLTRRPFHAMFSNPYLKSPRFGGSVGPSKFQIFLVKNTGRKPESVFSPPVIEGVWVGDDQVKIHVSIRITKWEKMIFKINRVFRYIFCIFLFLIPIVGFGIESYKFKEASGNYAPLNISPLPIIVLIVLYLFVIFILFLIFDYMPRRLTNQTFQRSKETIIDLFGLEIK